MTSCYAHGFGNRYIEPAVPLAVVPKKMPIFSEFEFPVDAQNAKADLRSEMSSFYHAARGLVSHITRNNTHNSNIHPSMEDNDENGSIHSHVVAVAGDGSSTPQQLQQQLPKPTNQLMQRIQRRDWEGVRARVLRYPWDAQYQSRRRNNSTPLHLVCLYHAPKDIVELVLDANPNALLIQDRDGWTPLHVILLYGREEETIQLLVRRGGAPALALQSQWVGAPLHLACRHGCSTLVLREILQAGPPEMVKIANETGNKPISILWNQFECNPQNREVVGRLQHKHNNNSNSNDSEMALAKRDARIVALIEQLTLLLGAALGKTVDESSCLLHDILSCYADFGNDLSPFVSLVLLLYPEQVRNVNDLGRLPLHVLVAAAADTTQRRHHRVPLPTPLELLLQMYPPAVLIPSGDGGRLALHLALAHGGRRWRSGGVKSLVKVAPDVLAFPDTVTQLFPYQLAASSAAAAKEENEDDLEALETILELLLACPYVLDHQPPTYDSN